MAATSAATIDKSATVEQRIAVLIGEMTLEEKIGQMCQVDAGLNEVTETLAEDIRTGKIGSVINQVDVGIVNELQRIAVEESRLHIPLMIGRDVIHGFSVVMPIPLGQAASWNPGLVEACAKSASIEAAAHGVSWTFAPMLDISRDPRWGRIAESLGEDPFLTASLGVSMTKGFQGENCYGVGNIAACAKHFVGYGAVEGGRDYATTNIPENELRNIYLEPFKAVVEAGITTVMTSFSDIDGVPATANEYLLRNVLRDEWGFEGLVVSDWNSIGELETHGFAENKEQAAFQAVAAGVSMEMAGDTYASSLVALVKKGELDMDIIDEAVSNVLGIKFQLGLFDNPYSDPGIFAETEFNDALQISHQAALESTVLLKNNGVLPLAKQEQKKIAVIGPMADDPYEQLGTWIFDGNPDLSVTGLQGICGAAEPETEVAYCQAMKTTRDAEADIAEAVQLAAASDAVILFLGEESILSGEAHCRADINLPGCQEDLVKNVSAAGKPVIAVIMAGRPLTLNNILDNVDALLYAWHPGTMGGQAIAELIFGDAVPSGKLPVTFPRHVGQVPIYYNHKNSGKPPTKEKVVHIDAIEAKTPQTSLGMCVFHLDEGYEPLFPFGFGLSYTRFTYSNIECSNKEISTGDAVTLSAEVTNEGGVAATEIVQLYLRDLVGSVTRPVRELKGFRRVFLEPGQTKRISFELDSAALSFYGRKQERVIEAGEFCAWIGGDSGADLETRFRLVL